MAISAAVKQKRERATEIIRGSSGEPVVTMEKYDEQFVRALNWYNCNVDDRELRKYLDVFLKKSGQKQYCEAVAAASLTEIKGIAVIGRLSTRGQYVALEDIERAAIRLDQIASKYIKPPTQKIGGSAVVISIQDRLNQQAGELGSQIDGEIDLFTINKSTQFSMKAFLQSNQVSSPVAKKLGELYKPLATELKLAYTKADPDLVEGYSNFTRNELKKFLAFIEGIVQECTQQVVSAQAQRKPRVRKPKPPSKIVAKIKFMREHAEFGLKSIDPAKIVGASELWTFNPNNRKMSVFRACDNGELTVKGTTIVNYDVNQSEVRTLRDPKAFIKVANGSGKRAINNAWKALKGKPAKPRARINEDMILFAVY